MGLRTAHRAYAPAALRTALVITLVTALVTAPVLVTAAAGAPSATATATARGSVAWTVEPTLALGQPIVDVSVRDVACPTATWCQAVGTYTAMDGRRHALVEHWDGSSWHVAALPRVRGDRNRLTQVSCATTTSCVALGARIPGTDTQLGLRWDGASWRRIGTAGIHDVTIFDLSCPTAHSCMAVGNRSAWQWDGSRWRSHQPVTWNPDVRDVFAAVSCTARDDCTLVGHRQRRAAPVDLPLVEHWNGSRWTVVKAVAPGVSGRLGSVSCVASGTCTAVGALDDGNQVLTHAPGTSWSASALPAPDGTSVSLVADRVSCAAVGTCTALGWSTDGVGGSTPFIATRSGGGPWSAADSPAGFDHAVSCGTTGHCVVTATSDPSGPWGYTTARAYTSAGLVLSTRSMVNPSGNPGGRLSTVSCLSSGFCGAAGATSTHNAFVGRRHGVWSLVQSDDATSHIADTSCVSSSFCLAVGRSVAPDRQPVALTWNGTRWGELSVTGGPSGAQVGLNRVSCVSSAWCLALGRADGTAFLIRWNGTTWSPVTGWTPPAHAALGSVSCTSTTWCVVVGSAGVGPAHQRPVIAVLDGTGWSQRSGVSSSLPSTSLSSVSCTSRRFCMVVGQAGGRAGTGTKPAVRAVTFAERWDGAHWRRAAGARTLPTWDTMNVQLDSVSCTGADACLATNRTWAGVWDGRTWAPSRPPAAVGGLGSLDDVSCAGGLFCVGVGAVIRHAYQQDTTVPLTATSSPQQ
jgi:hypothetical protein